MPEDNFPLQDTLGPAFDTLPAYAKATIRSLMQQQPVQQVYIAKEQKNEGSEFIVILSVLIVGLLILLIAIRRSAKQKGITAPADLEDTEPQPQMHQDYLVYQGAALGLSTNNIRHILERHYPYYNALDSNLQQRFVERLETFMAEKTFIIHGGEAYKEMPVLLSAAAIQITFGLKRFRLPYYQYLQIHPEEYFADDALRVLAGHVQGSTITIAFNQLLKGLNDPKDGVNVGLHEMAHALYFQHLVADWIKGKTFVDRFNDIMEEGAEVYELKHHQHQVFTANAFKDLQEFWAESTELFFEKPEVMQQHYPDIYDAMKTLLQQDPIYKNNPIAMYV